VRDRATYNQSTNQTTWETLQSGQKIQGIDGDGLVIKSSGWELYEEFQPYASEQVPVTSVYYVRSSILGGEIVTMARGSSLQGKKFKTTVFADGTALAIQSSTVGTSVSWQTKDASGSSAIYDYGRVEHDPSGSDVGLSYESTLPPPPPPPQEQRQAGGFGFDWETYYPSYIPGGSYVGNRRMDCVVDGISGQRCDIAFNQVLQGSATIDTNLNHRYLLAQFGLVETKRREAVYATRTNRVDIEVDGEIQIGKGFKVKEVIGYVEVTSWELTSSTAEYVSEEPMQDNPDCYTFYDFFSSLGVQKDLNDLWAKTVELAKDVDENNSTGEKWEGRHPGPEVAQAFYLDEEKWSYARSHLGIGQPPKNGETAEFAVSDFIKSLTVGGRLVMVVHSHPPNEPKSVEVSGPYAPESSRPPPIKSWDPKLVDGGYSGSYVSMADSMNLGSNAYPGTPFLAVIVYGHNKFELYGNLEEKAKTTCLTINPVRLKNPSLPSQ
jgi:hypothetical protein